MHSKNQYLELVPMIEFKSTLNNFHNKCAIELMTVLMAFSQKSLPVSPFRLQSFSRAYVSQLTVQYKHILFQQIIYIYI